MEAPPRTPTVLPPPHRAIDPARWQSRDADHHRSIRTGGAVADKPNILVIWGDDIGISNLSCYSDGLMGYRTPNIDRLAADHQARREPFPRLPLHGTYRDTSDPIGHRNTSQSPNRRERTAICGDPSSAIAWR
jgi:hypothetical protein